MIKKEPHFNRSSYWCVLILFLMPGVSQASVFINEIAWMGSTESANHEWIELYNDASATVVDGWILSDAKNLSIELSGTIPAQSFAVLERTSDASAPGNAFFIYTGALGNTGATLRLENAEGQLIDLVSGGDNWELVGGDNTTKETAQYSSKGWLTAAATPGLQNKTVATVTEAPTPETKEEKDSSTKSKDSSSPESVRLTLPDVTLALAVDAQTVGYVNQTIPFTVNASGIGKSLHNSLKYQWNFGDGATASLDKTTHQYAYPGIYVVTVHAQYKRQKQITRHQITILPVAISLTQNSRKDIQINNDSPYEIDISGYSLTGGKTFTFPQYSILLPNQTVTIAREKVRTSNNQMLALYDTQNEQLASLLPLSLRIDSSLANTASENDLVRAVTSDVFVAPVRVQNSISSQQPLVSADTTRNDSVTTTSVSEPALSNAQPTESTASSESSSSVLSRQERLSYVGLVILILLGIFAVYLTPRRNQLDERLVV